MRGEVLHYDQQQGFGFISGADGNRYSFGRESLRRQATLARGTAVEFQPQGGQARDVFAIRAEIPPRPASPFGREATGAAVTDDLRDTRNTGLWSYFRRSLTTDYATFRARARRKEYWGFALFWYLGFAVICALCLVLDQTMGNIGSTQTPYVTIVVGAAAMLGSIIPWLAVTVRRVHDIGLSGWFVLLSLIPYIGGLIVFVFTLIPSQKHENRWGPVPAGVPIPPPFMPPPGTATG